ncbi:MAG: hypothetical protein MRY72_10865 [Aquisalinus sp.]|nr:hypothetical protein [Aquisalinus sp.]
MPQLVRHFIVHGTIGAGMSLAVIAIFLIYDLGDMRTLIMASASNIFDFSILAIVLSTIFAAVQISIFVMLQPWDED